VLKQLSLSRGNTLALAIWLLLPTGSLVRAAEQILAPVQVTPRDVSVLLLPALDATSDAKNMQEPRHVLIRHRVEYEFITREFKMLGETMAAHAAESTTPRINLGDLSARSAANLDLVAKQTGADWVVGLVVEEAKLSSSVGNDFQVHTRVRVQVWDARRHGWIANGDYTGHARGEGTPIFVFKNSLDEAAKGALRNVLTNYPQVIAVLQEESLKDYLAGQTTPFVGDPGKSFSGLQVLP
jgi:hypothetical protein